MSFIVAIERSDYRHNCLVKNRTVSFSHLVATKVEQCATHRVSSLF